MKKLLSNIPPHPVGQASLEKTASGFDHSSRIIIDIPLTKKQKLQREKYNLWLVNLILLVVVLNL
jgi:hypothetical protein